jgi:bifunctional UDP-N-acetylglucosamine pyrophosphorylase/glucosamine-1-phosphate N-acetyltransferase
VHLKNVKIGQGVTVRTGTVAEDAIVGDHAAVGPYAHLRPGTVLGEKVKVGNFVETKKAVFGKGAKASHLSYIGDAEVGADVNIGAGTITCNYDGVNKHKTVLEEGVFIGSDTQLVAPVTVGRGAYVGAGSTITKDVPADSLALSRTPQRNIEDWAKKKKERQRKP